MSWLLKLMKLEREICVMFDGRKDQVLTKTVLSDHGGIEIRETVSQEHYVVVEEPGSIY